MDIGFAYNYVRWAHLVCVLLWVGGMIYLPLVMRVHAELSTPSEAFVKLERRILRGMMRPAIILTFVFGVWLAGMTGAGTPEQGGWIHVKILLVLVLSYFHMQLAMARKRLENGTYTKGVRHLERISAFSALIAVLAIYLAVVKPF